MLFDYRKKIIEAVEEQFEIKNEISADLISKPPKEEMGDYALPCFVLAKTLKKAPNKIAEELVSKLKLPREFTKVQATGPYINFYLDKIKSIETLYNLILNKEYTKISGQGKGKTVLIDYSSPNIAKTFHIGHLRSTNIGNSLSHLYRFLGYQVVRINHLGDWGTQFGTLIAAYKRWGDKQTIENEGVPALQNIYVKFNKAAEENPVLLDEARGYFKQLEQGNPEIIELWKWFKDISLKEFDRIYDMLDVEFDAYTGESFYENMLEQTVARIEEAGLAKQSEGATIVDLESYNLPPCLLKKQDGATLYATRDLAAAQYRWEHYHFDKMLYVVASQQSTHFKQVFKVLELMGKEWIKKAEHVEFGIIRIEGSMGSTRKGKVILLEDVIEKAKELALEKLEENEYYKKLDTRVKDKQAQSIAISAIKFFDLKNSRIKDIDFNWEDVLNTKGETGVYLQYTHARLNGILNTYRENIGPLPETMPAITEDCAFEISKILNTFTDKVVVAAQENEPYIIARFLLELSQMFSIFYTKNRVVNKEDIPLSQERIFTVLCVKQILAEGLKLMGIQPMERL